jgi:hypothetical protein
MQAIMDEKQFYDNLLYIVRLVMLLADKHGNGT